MIKEKEGEKEGDKKIFASSTQESHKVPGGGGGNGGGDVRGNRSQC